MWDILSLKIRYSTIIIMAIVSLIDALRWKSQAALPIRPDPTTNTRFDAVGFKYFKCWRFHKLHHVSYIYVPNALNPYLEWRNVKFQSTSVSEGWWKARGYPASSHGMDCPTDLTARRAAAATFRPAGTASCWPWPIYALWVTSSRHQAERRPLVWPLRSKGNLNFGNHSIIRVQCG